MEMRIWSVFDLELTPEERKEKWLSYYKESYTHWFKGSALERIVYKRAIALAEKDNWKDSFDNYFREANTDEDSPILMAILFGSFVVSLWLMAALA